MPLVSVTLDDILRTSCHNTKRGILSDIYNVVKQMILDWLHTNATGVTLKIQIPEKVNTEAAAGRRCKKLLILSSFMAAISTFVRCKTDSTIADKGTVVTKGLSPKQVDVNET